jgi:hypothetical protein
MAESDEHSVTTCLENGDFAPLLYRVTMDRSVFLLNDPTPQTHNPMVVSIILCQCNFFLIYTTPCIDTPRRTTLESGKCIII